MPSMAGVVLLFTAAGRATCGLVVAIERWSLRVAADVLPDARGVPAASDSTLDAGGARSTFKNAVMVRVRLGSGLARLATAPLLSLDLEAGATVEDVFARLAREEPGVVPALASVLPVVAGEHAERTRTLDEGDEVALLLPMSGG